MREQSRLSRFIQEYTITAPKCLKCTNMKNFTGSIFAPIGEKVVRLVVQPSIFASAFFNKRVKVVD